MRKSCKRWRDRYPTLKTTAAPAAGYIARGAIKKADAAPALAEQHRSLSGSVIGNRRRDTDSPRAATIGLCKDVVR